jgi:mono/diheme cytochrome c family protein
MRSDIKQGLFVAAATLVVSTAAFGFPWDTDMADSQAVEAYEKQMKGIPEGVVSQDNVQTPVGFAPEYNPNVDWNENISSPFPTDAAHAKLGAEMYEIYCTPCHGDGINLGKVAEPGRFPAVPALAGDNGRLKDRTDFQAYLAIRYGRGIMPYYGWAMSDEEMWSIVQHMRTLPNAKHTPPPPPKPAVEEGGEQ